MLKNKIDYPDQEKEGIYKKKQEINVTKSQITDK